MKLPSLFFVSLALALIMMVGAASAETITVGYSGNTGTYTVDGTNDQTAINSALTYANTHGTVSSPVVVLLKGSHTYSIRNQILMGSNTILTAEAGVILKVPDGALGTTTSNCVLPDGKALIDQMAGVIPQNVEIHGFAIDGNCDQQDTDLGIVHPGSASEKVQSAGSGVERIIEFSGSSSSSQTSNISVYDMDFYDAFGEALHVFYGSDIDFYDCTAENMQHDAVFLISCTGGQSDIYNNNFKGITDGCVRVDNCQKVKIHDNTMSPYRGTNNNGAYIYGANGIQIANEASRSILTDDIEVYNNVLNNIDLCGIWINDQLKTAGTTSQDVFIHHNTFNNCGAQGAYTYSVPISVYPWGNGVSIENNTFNYSNQNGVQLYSAIGSGTYSVGIRNNNFLYTKNTGTGLASTYRGYDIYNHAPTNLVGTITGNYFYGAATGKVYPTTLLHTNDATSPIAGAGGNGSSMTPDNSDVIRTGVTINGYVYYASLETPIEGSVVTIMNGSWSETQVTNTEGYYEFDVLSNTGIYYITASATDYYGTINSAGSGLPINLTSSSYGLDIALVRSPTYINPHMVTFTICSPWGTKYEGVSVNATNPDGLITNSGLTDAYGKITFKMEENAQYTLHCYDEAQNIDKTYTLYASDSHYSIWVWNAHKTNNTLAVQQINTTPASPATYVGYGIDVTELNVTHRNINQTIISRDNNTLTYTTTITQVDVFGNATGNFTNTSSGTTNSTSFAVAVPNNATYKVVTNVQHPNYRHIYTNIVTAKADGINPFFNFGWEYRWCYEAAGYLLVLLLGGLIGGRNLPLGVIGCIGLGLFNLHIGWWQYDTGGLIMFYFGIMLGFGYILTKRG